MCLQFHETELPGQGWGRREVVVCAWLTAWVTARAWSSWAVHGKTMQSCYHSPMHRTNGGTRALLASHMDTVSWWRWPDRLKGRLPGQGNCLIRNTCGQFFCIPPAKYEAMLLGYQRCAVQGGLGHAAQLSEHPFERDAAKEQPNAADRECCGTVCCQDRGTLLWLAGSLTWIRKLEIQIWSVFESFKWDPWWSDSVLQFQQSSFAFSVTDLLAELLHNRV